MLESRGSLISNPSQTGPIAAALQRPHATLSSLELTGGPTRNYSVPEGPKHGVLSFGEPHLGSQPVRTAFRSPWQNGIAERWVASVRRDLLNHVIVLNERHLRRLLKEYIRYYHEDRTHLGLGKDTPDGRVATLTPSSHKVISLQRLGGLHHRYTIAA